MGSLEGEMSEYIASGRTSSYVGCNDCKGLRKLLKGRRPRGMADCACTPRWVQLCKRTDDPKLGWIERELQARGIPTRRGIPSWHADATLDVPEEHADAAWALLGERLPGRRRTIDDMPDDHADFVG